MLTYVKVSLKKIFFPVSYVCGIFLMLYTAIKDVRPGLMLLIVLIPQPNLWYKYHAYPLGKDFIDILFIALIIGTIMQKRTSDRGRNTAIIAFYIAISYASLINSSLQFGLPFPITSSNHFVMEWKNYVQMIAIYLLIVNNIKEEREYRVYILLISVVLAFVAFRVFRNFYAGESFDYGKRAAGPFEVVRLNANHMGAFMVHYVAMLVGMFIWDDDRKRKVFYAIAVSFGIIAILYSYSRGAYLAMMIVILYFGIMKKPVLILVFCLVIFTWKDILPTSVVDRITMTRSEGGELEASAGARLNLWEHAWGIFKAHPVFGVGYGGFGQSVPEGVLTDTHSFFVKTLCEQGLFGLSLLIAIIARAFHSGWVLISKAKTNFTRGMGYGFTGCIIAIVVTNMFGDRWSYFVLGGYFWALWGLIDCAIMRSNADCA